MPLLLSKQTCFLQFGSGLGQKNSKETVSVENFKGRGKFEIIKIVVFNFPYHLIFYLL